MADESLLSLDLESDWLRDFSPDFDDEDFVVLDSLPDSDPLEDDQLPDDGFTSRDDLPEEDVEERPLVPFSRFVDDCVPLDFPDADRDPLEKPVRLPFVAFCDEAAPLADVEDPDEDSGRF